MSKIHFISISGAPNLEPLRSSAVSGWHVWTPDNTIFFGVVEPLIDPPLVADQLTALGLLVIPGVKDDTAPDGRIVAALAKFGVVPSDKGKDVAAKMATASGMPVMKPNLF